jgi:transposase
MARSKQPCAIPTSLSPEQFDKFVCPFLTEGRRGPRPKVAPHAIFNYILRALYLGCPWKELPIACGQDGKPEIHYTRVYRQFRRWHDDGCFDVIFANSVFALHDSDLLDTSVVHGDGTTTAAKKGGDNLGFSGHKHLKGDKVVAICDRRGVGAGIPRRVAWRLP